MNLINCPECNHKISLTAGSCPNCGYDMSAFDCYYSPNGDSVLRKYNGFDDYVLVPGVKKIGRDAFGGCEGINTIEIPSSVTSIEDGAFSGCTYLHRIKLPNTLKNIGNSAFFNCEWLEEITIPNSVISIGKDAFYGCNSLKHVEIPSGVTSIGENAFYRCQRLNYIVIPSSVTSIGKDAFKDGIEILFDGNITQWKNIFKESKDFNPLEYYKNVKLFLKDKNGELPFNENRYSKYSANKTSVKVMANTENSTEKINDNSQNLVNETKANDNDNTIIIPDGTKELTEELFNSLNIHKRLYIKNLIIPKSVKKISVEFMFCDLADYKLDKYIFTEEEKNLYIDYFENYCDPGFLFIRFGNIYFEGSVNEWEAVDNRNFLEDVLDFKFYINDSKGDVKYDGKKYKIYLDLE